MGLRNLTMQLINLFSGILCARFRSVAIFPLPGPVKAEENLTRFIFESNTTKKNQLKTQSFRPRKIDKQLSVYRTGNLSREIILRIGHCFIEKRRLDGKLLLGMVDLPANAISQVNQGIFLKRTLLPHPRHANIHFPPNNSPVDNERWNSIAKALIEKSNKPSFISTSE